MNYKTVLFDLDGTLYPNKIGLWNEITSKIYAFMHQELDIESDKIPEIREKYYSDYGTTLRGLQHDFPDLDTELYLDFVHNVNTEKYIEPNLTLRNNLIELPLEKWIFTNADKNHADRTLKILGIDDLFEGIIDVRAIKFHAKPHPTAYQIAIQLSNVIPTQSILIDDQERNLLPAKDLGLYTIHIADKHKNCQAHTCVETINDAIPMIQNLLKQQ